MEAKKVFSGFALPLPQEGEFYSAEKNNFTKQIVFLAEYGLAFRFYEPFSIPSNDLILQPLYKARFERMDFDIVPIIKTGIEKIDSDILHYQLQEEGVDWGDFSPHNAGYLPDADGTTGLNRPVVVDVCNTITLRDKFNAASATVQKTIYAPLLDAAQRIYEQGLSYEAENFLRISRDFASQTGAGLSLMERNVFLIEDEGQSRKALFAARVYAESLRRADLI